MIASTLFLVLAQFFLGAGPGQDQPKEQPKDQSNPSAQDQSSPQFEEGWMISTSATVDSIDPKTRKMTVTGPQGNRFSFKVSDSVKNFDKIKPNDKVVVDYFDSVAVQAVKQGTTADGQEMLLESAAPGELPAGAAAEETTVVATVERIDRATPSITLKGEDGKLTTIRVRHPERLKLVKVGDTLKITFCQALAVAVEPPPKEAH